MPTEKMLVSNAVFGIIMAIVFAFIVLLIATKNIIVSIFAIICVAMIIFSTVACFYWNGQEFGNLESIAVVMLIGFSVDYIVHFSADYVHS